MLLHSVPDEQYDIFARLIPSEQLRVRRITTQTKHLAESFEFSVKDHLGEAVKFLLSPPERLSTHDYLLMSVLNHLNEQWSDEYIPIACELLEALGKIRIEEDNEDDVVKLAYNVLNTEKDFHSYLSLTAFTSFANETNIERLDTCIPAHRNAEVVAYL